MRWFDAQGGHFETKGVSPDGEVITVPRHRHHVKLNIFRVDIGLKYQFGSDWILESNIPYETKTQEATIEELPKYPVTATQREAILHNRDNHHRNETYTGLTDTEAFLGYQTQGLLIDNDFLMARIGTTIPFGKTEEDPWKLGDKGFKHLHIQFGTGTFNPIADLHYSLPLYKGLGANGSIRGKFPFYENSKTYQGSYGVYVHRGSELSFKMSRFHSRQATSAFISPTRIGQGNRTLIPDFDSVWHRSEHLL